MIVNFATQKVEKFLPLSVISQPMGPAMSLLTWNGSTVEAFVIEAARPSTMPARLDNDGLNAIYSVRFDEGDDLDDTLCDWDLLFESFHIAFMQQEALRFSDASTEAGSPVEEALT